jgi:hypothetical protein
MEEKKRVENGIKAKVKKKKTVTKAEKPMIQL